MQNRTNNPSSKKSVTEFCRNTCRRIISQLERVKDRLQFEFSTEQKLDPRLVSLALNEAEAEAWRTGFPQLVFPMLAEEKAGAVAQWSSRQKRIWPSSASLAFGA
jgi:hypothetical protein